MSKRAAQISAAADQRDDRIEIQEFLERREWIEQSGNPVAFARHLQAEPLAGVVSKPVIIQFAKTDQNVPNPTTTAILRAGNLADVATYYRHDLAYAEDNTLAENPHGFLNAITQSSSLGWDRRNGLSGRIIGIRLTDRAFMVPIVT